jgi:ribosomal RNA adenine dimethylase
VAGKSRPYGGPGAPWEPECLGLQSVIGDSPLQWAWRQRMGIAARHYLTVVRPEDADWILQKLAGRYEGKTVIEIGAGIGVLAARLAERARHVYAIEADPSWNLVYAKYGGRAESDWDAASSDLPEELARVVPRSYHTTAINLTWIFGRAQDMVGQLRGDLAICVTGSDEAALRELAGAFAPDVCMPWQDWRDGKATVQWGHW